MTGDDLEACLACVARLILLTPSAAPPAAMSGRPAGRPVS